MENVEKIPNEVRHLKVCDGQGLKNALIAATSWLERNSAAINALNVFPVPDGDTGTNMLLTMRATVEAIAGSPEHSAGKIAESAAHGALMGARGNSGVILSQILRGLARGLDDKDSFEGADLAEALVEASTTAYKGVSKPVEGTILTVIREASEAAKACSPDGSHSVLTVVRAAADEARKSVERTPLLLSVLRDAGVVDAGGKGLSVILDGILHYILGDVELVATRQVDLIEPSTAGFYPQKESFPQETYGYCTEFIIQGQDLDIDSIRQQVVQIGDSAIIVGDKNLARVHVHTFDPGSALTYAVSLGTLRNIKVENMQEQHHDFLMLQEKQSPAIKIGTVAVVAGEGLKDVFRSLGTSTIVEGGQTMNPSTEQLLQAIEILSAENIIVLPNNANIVLTAKQAQSLSEKNVFIVPTETIPQGIAALIALNNDNDISQNLLDMERAAKNVKSAAVTTAVRSVQLNGLVVQKGQVIGLAEGKLMTAGNSVREVVSELLSKMEASGAELLTVYFGNGVERSEAMELVNLIKGIYPELEIELIEGGQPHYSYIISAE